GDLPADRGRGRQILAPAAEGGLGATQFLVVFANAETTLSGLELERRRSVCYAPLLDGLDQDRAAPQGQGLRSPPRAPRGRERSRPARGQFAHPEAGAGA